MQYCEGPLGGMEIGPAGGAQAVVPLLVRPVRADEVVHWDRLMATHHYLGVRRLVGESLRYVAEEGGQWVALLGWGSAAGRASRPSWEAEASLENRPLRWAADAFGEDGYEAVQRATEMIG